MTVSTQEGPPPEENVNITYTLKSKEVCRDDGTCTRTVYPNVVSYLHNGEYKPINNTIHECDLSDYPNWEYCNTDGLYSVYFRNSTDEANQLMAFMLNNKTWVKTLPQSIFYYNESDVDMIARLSDYSVSARLTNGSKIYDGIYYRNAFGTGFTLGYTYNNNRLVKKIRIRRLSDLPVPTIGSKNLSFVFKEKYSFSPNLRQYIDNRVYDNTTKRTSNRVNFKRNNQTIISFPKPYAVDSNDSYVDLEYYFLYEGGNLKIGILTPYEWLNATDRVYPVFIDPSTEYNYNSTFESNNMWAYTCNDNTDAPPPDNTLPSGCTSGFTEKTTDSDLDSSDGGYICTGVTCTKDSGDSYTYALFNVTIDETPADVTDINWTWEGVKRSTSGHVHVYHWNYSNSQWVECGENDGWSDIFIYCQSSTPTDFINSAGEARMMSKDVDATSSNHKIDWVKVDITYTVSSDSCSPTSPLTSDHTYDCADNCAISTAVDAAGYDLLFNGSGTASITADITDCGNVTIIGKDSSNKCTVTVTSATFCGS